MAMSDVLDLVDVSVVRQGRKLLDAINWQAREGERWVIVGPNGAGKTTLLQVVCTQIFPTSGTVDVLGERLGAVDVFELRPRIGVASTAIAERLKFSARVRDIVLSAAYGMLGRWREAYDDLDTDRADAILGWWGMGDFLDRSYGSLSEGERKRVLIARSLMADPELLLLDEPAAGLDLGGREDLVYRLGNHAKDPNAPVTVLVTHHVEEIPPGFGHILMLRQGSVVAAGPIAETLNSDNASACFGLDIKVDNYETESGIRWYARGA
jgi:iron complex transport system ATP-binding protein